MRRLLVAAAVAIVLGCQQSPPPGSGKVPVGSLTAQLKAEGDQLAGRGEYEAAAVKYQQAVRQEPGDASMWFALGTALSHLGRREETVEAFRRVLQLGTPESQEVQVARRWLVSAGVLSESGACASASEGRATADPSAAPQPPSGPMGGLRGKTEWKGVTPENLIMVKIILSGDEPATQGRTFARSINLGQPYAFEKVAPGNYRLMASAGRTQLWDERVYVEADKQTVLNLSPGNSSVSTAEFPGEVHKDEGDFHKDYDRYEHARPREYEPPPAGERR
ncbi:MAG: tetratricopeptide repeat protein [Candidatus Rokubacteria bacterium]|nr:tetratricopeptide repeat protein [Candidatus Rokubacteria bacterium]